MAFQDLKDLHNESEPTITRETEKGWRKVLSEAGLLLVNSNSQESMSVFKKKETRILRTTCVEQEALDNCFELIL